MYTIRKDTREQGACKQRLTIILSPYMSLFAEHQANIVCGAFIQEIATV